jgi:hypothetical protein
MATTAMLLAALACASAQAQSYGELGKPFFGSGKSAFIEEQNDHAFGVDPTTSDVYVGDQPSANEYRIQEFGSTGTPIASVSLKFEGSERAEGIEGIAVDPKEKRIYALVMYEREGKEGSSKFVDPELLSAGTLFAFSTEPSGTKLVAATGTKTEGKLEGVLVNTTTFNAQSEVVQNPSQSALIEPGGITVDPTTHDIVILAKEEQCDKKTTECEETLLAAAQQVTPAGTLGKRWVDTGECFEGVEGASSCFKETHKGETKEEEEEEGADQPGEPNSPVVTASGRVLVDVTGGNEIWEIPKSFESGEVPADAPKPVPIASAGTIELHNPLQKLLYFPGAPEPREGGALAYVQESGEGANEGRLYQTTEVEGIAGKHTNPGVLVMKLSETSASEVGWTGGQNKIEQEAAAGGGCWISGFSQPIVAAAASKVVYVFDPNHFPAVAHELPAPQVDTFGPSGSHCPTAIATAPVASLNGTTDGTSANPAPVGQKVTLSSKLSQANALKVSWSFGDGSSPVEVDEPEFQTTKVQHAFASAGEKTVTETITTDNLAEPTVTVSSKVIAAVTGGGAPPSEEETNSPPPPPSTETPTTTTTTTTGTTTVLATTSTKGNPAATLAGTSLAVAASGSLAVKVSCPAGETSCVGTITLKTINAVSAGHGKKKAVLTLASGSFTVAGGSSKAITLHLSAAARKLLASSHVLKARATILAHDATGATHTGVATVTLKPAKKSAHH